MTTQNELDQLLDKSITEYSSILLLLQAIAEKRNNDQASELSSASIGLFKEQQTAAQTDQSLMRMLEEHPKSLQDSKVAQRTDLIKKILKINSSMTSQFEAVKALMSDELQQIKAGRTAMQGYQQAENTHGKHINGAL